MLTVARSSEARFAVNGEVVGEVWVFPSERTKTGREHRIPLTDEAISIIK